MKRYSILAATAVVGAGVAFQSSVTLQASTPGTAQNGHLNITGTARAGSVVANSTAPTGTVFGGDFRTASTSGRGVLGNASATSGVTHGGLFQSASTSGRGVTGISSATTGSAVGGFFTSNSVNGKGVQGSSNALSGLNYGVYGRNVSPQGFALYGEGNVAMTGNLGVGTGTNPLNNRLEVEGGARITANEGAFALTVVNTGGPGVFGIGTSGGSFTSQTNAGTGVTGQAFGGGRSIGVYGEGQSPQGFALFGEGNAGVTGNLVIGRSNPSAHRLEIEDNNGSTLGSASIINGGVDFPLTSARAGLAVHVGGPGVTRGIGAIAQSSDGNTSTGIFGSAIGSGTNIGVHGSSIIGAGSFAGFFEGDSHTTGTASASVKNFMIDHPMDPENKVLSHSSVESDERMNIYRGVLTTDAQGFATATVPSWFDALNEDIQYQLTVIGDESEDFVLVKVAKKLMNGKFKVRTSKGGIEVNWQVSGRRHDPTAKFYPLEVERMKSKNEKGKYYAPEAYGKDKTLGIAYPSPSKKAVVAAKQ